MAKKTSARTSPSAGKKSSNFKWLAWLCVMFLVLFIVVVTFQKWMTGGSGTSPGTPAKSHNIAAATATQQNTNGNNNSLLSLIQINGKDSGGKQEDTKEGSFEVNSLEWSPIINFTAKNIETFGDSECYYLVDEHLVYFVDQNQNLWKIDEENGRTVPRSGAKFPRDCTTFQLKTMKGRRTVRYVISPLKEIGKDEHSRQ